MTLSKLIESLGVPKIFPKLKNKIKKLATEQVLICTGNGSFLIFWSFQSEISALVTFVCVHTDTDIHAYKYIVHYVRLYACVYVHMYMYLYCVCVYMYMHIFTVITKAKCRGRLGEL